MELKADCFNLPWCFSLSQPFSLPHDVSEGKCGSFICSIDSGRFRIRCREQSVAMSPSVTILVVGVCATFEHSVD